jgi:hypothetical protein
MDNTICYLNTDLDLVCQQDLTELAHTFEVSGISPLHVALGDDQQWYATFETDEQHGEPELSIAQMLTVIESLAEPLHSLWMQCTRREFNIGYDCGERPCVQSRTFGRAIGTLGGCRRVASHYALP